MKIGLVDVGGGFRGIYACGVMDYCMDRGIRFDLGIGVSAGAANLSSFLSGQRGRNYRFYIQYGPRRQYAGLWNFIRKGSFVDLDYVYGTLSNSDGEDPLDYSALQEDPMELVIVATRAGTGEPRYFEKKDLAQDRYDPLKASSAIPFVCRPYFLQGEPYYDGALGDPVPVEKAFQLGCDRVVLLLTKPEAERRTPGNDIKFAARIRKRYPLAAERLCQRAQRYNDSVALAQSYAREGKVLIVSPEDTCGVTTLSRKGENLERLYQKGYADGEKILRFLKK